MANEAEWTYGTITEIVGTGAAPGNATIAASGGFTTTASTGVAAATHLNYPLADITLTCSFGTAPTAGSTIDIFARRLNVDGGTNDAPQPDANFLETHVGQWLVDAVTATQYLQTTIPLFEDQEYFFRNNADQAVSASWTVDIKAKTFAPGA